SGARSRMSEERIIKGEIESWSQQIREFGKNDAGSRGCKIDGIWHNQVGKLEKLQKLHEEFPPGSIVKFTEKENKRGYWDIEGSIEKTDKKEAYGPDTPANTPPGIQVGNQTGTQKLQHPENVKQINLSVSFKAAVKAVKLWVPKEGPVDLDIVRSKILAETQNFYIGLKKAKVYLQESGEW
ncbi:unnamed protein product, partial [marine sediment metagenome]